MKRNVGKADRIGRAIAGVILLSLWFVLPEDMRWISLIGILPLISAATGYCFLYTLCGMSSCCATGRAENMADGVTKPCCGGRKCGTDKPTDGV